MSKFRESISSTAICAVIAAIMSLTGCGGGSKSMEMAPSETVKAFCKAIASGDWEQAKELCDTASMKDYLQANMQEWQKLQTEDEGAMAVAESIMAQTSVTIEQTSKEDDKRVVIYTLAVEEFSKKCKATLKKEAGAWRVERIQSLH